MNTEKKQIDLKARVRLGLNFLNNNVDKERGFLPYFTTIFKTNPAEARHDWPDFGDLTSRYVEAFIYARKMLGGLEYSEAELKLRELLISYFSEADGLSYRPKFDKPYYSTISRKDYNENVAEGFDQARVLWGLLAWYDESKELSLLGRIEKMVDGLSNVLVRKDDYGYFDRSAWTPGLEVAAYAEPMPHQFYFMGTQINPLVRYYHISGNEVALDIAQRLTNYILYQTDYFGADGSWIVDIKKSDVNGEVNFEGEVDGHSHSRLGTIAGIVALGRAIDNRELVEKAKRCYDWFYDEHCSSFGWSPEFIGRYGDADEGFETCVLMDQIAAALELCDAGYAEYYEQIEKFARNQLMEAQLTDISLFKSDVPKDKNWLSTFDNVGEMVFGGFVGWGAPNDFIGNCNHHYCLMNCCGPAGIRAMFDVWSNIYTIDKDVITVNVFMDFEDENIVIKNNQIEGGGISILVKNEYALRLRRRSWMNVDGMEINSGVLNVPFVIDSDCINISADDCYCRQMGITQYLPQENEHVFVNGRDYDVVWMGDTVVEIEPQGEFMPLYKNRVTESERLLNTVLG